MPSGAKRRKAAKKKKGGANNPTSNNNASSITNTNDHHNYTPHEHDKDSDGGEAEVETNSPTSEDHHDDAFNETSAEVDKSGTVSIVSLDTETKSMEGVSEVGTEENGANKAFEIVEERKSIDCENKSTNEVPDDPNEVKKVESVPVSAQKDKVEPKGKDAIEILEGNQQNELVDIAGTEPVKESIYYKNKSTNEVPDDLQEVKKVEPEGNGAIEILEGSHQNELVDIAGTEMANESIDYKNKSTNEVPDDLQEVKKVEPVPFFAQKDEVEPKGNGAIEILEGSHQNELVDVAGTESAKESIDYKNKSTNEVPNDLQEVKKVQPVLVFTQKDKIEPEGSGTIEILESNCQNEVDIACIESTKESLDSDNEKSNGVAANYKLEVAEELEEPDDFINRTTQLNNLEEHVDLLTEEPIAVADTAPAPESSAVYLGKLEETDDVINRTTQLNNSEEHVGMLSEEPIAVADGAPGSEGSAVELGEPEASVSEKIIHMVESTPAEDMIASESDLKENGKELPSLIQEVSLVSSSELDCSSNKIKEKVAPITDETDGNDQGKVAVGKEDSLQPYEGSTTQASKKPKDIGAVESTEQQPSVSLAPRAAQRTLWMSCCGLFEALMGSR